LKKDSSSSLLFAYAKSKFTNSTQNLSQKIIVICAKTGCVFRTSLVGGRQPRRPVLIERILRAVEAPAPTVSFHTLHPVRTFPVGEGLAPPAIFANRYGRSKPLPYNGSCADFWRIVDHGLSRRQPLRYHFTPCTLFALSLVEALGEAPATLHSGDS